MVPLVCIFSSPKARNAAWIMPSFYERIIFITIDHKVFTL